MSDWTDMIVGDRMAVDGSFSSEIDASSFSRQEWGLVMTAVEFEIEGPEDPSTARLLANTDNLPAVLPELKRVAEARQQMESGRRGRNGGGVLGSLKNALGLNKDEEADEEKVDEARQLAEAYAAELQRHLESRGRWEEVCAAAAD